MKSRPSAAVYYTKPAGGAYGSPLSSVQAFRARWIPTSAGLVLVHDVDRKKLAIGDTVVELSAGFSDIYAIYPLATAYPDLPVDGIELAVVGSGDEHRVLHVALTSQAVAFQRR